MHLIGDANILIIGETISVLWDSGTIGRIALVVFLAMIGYLQWQFFFRREDTDSAPPPGWMRSGDQGTDDLGKWTSDFRKPRPVPLDGITIKGASLAELGHMEQTLMERAAASRAWAPHSRAAMQTELFAALDRSGVFAGFTDIHAGYASLIADTDHGLEALKRGLFLQWYAHSEPGCFTGIYRLYAEPELAIIRELDRRLASGETDSELRTMMVWYDREVAGDSGDYLRTFEEFPTLRAFLDAPDLWNGEGQDVPWTAERFRGRGQLGKYFESQLEKVRAFVPDDEPTGSAPYRARDIHVVRADQFVQSGWASGAERTGNVLANSGYVICAPSVDWAEIAEVIDGPATDPDQSHIRAALRDFRAESPDAELPDTDGICFDVNAAILAQTFLAIAKLDMARDDIEGVTALLLLPEGTRWMQRAARAHVQDLRERVARKPSQGYEEDLALARGILESLGLPPGELDVPVRSRFSLKWRRARW
jgi:hypothetical protein